jgi:Ca2+/Na+ antiporter
VAVTTLDTDTATATVMDSDTSTTTNSILFPICTFILSLYTLEHSTSLFITSTARLAQTFHVSETLISLLTAGAEWEELFVVIAALLQHRPRLALGNVLGSCVANILGAFSLGLLVVQNQTQTQTNSGSGFTSFTSFDASARIYAIVLFTVTTAVVVLWGIGWLWTKVMGGILVAAFAIYVVGVGWSIYRGILDAPEDSDADSDSDSDGNSDTASESGSTPNLEPEEGGGGGGAAAAVGSDANVDARNDIDESETTALLNPRRQRQRQHHRYTRILWDLGRLLVGFVALSMSGYLLSHSSRLLAARFNISETVFGATLLSFATTLPEKFVAVVSGARGHHGIMVANTVGSNIFLLTLCLGVTILGSATASLAGSASYTHEIFWVWASSACLTVVIVVGSHRLVGVAMLVAYMTFVVLEFVLNRA